MLKPSNSPHSESRTVALHRPNRAHLLASTALVAGMALGGQAMAQQAWDPSAAAGVQGGTGAWDAATANWTLDNGASNTVHDNVAPIADAVFGVAGGTVTVTGPLNIGNVTFDVGGYVVNGSSLAIAGTAATISVTIGSATISSGLNQGASAASLTKSGAGLLVLSGTNGYQGDTTVTAGALRLQGGTAISDTSGTVTVNTGATLEVTASEAINGFAGAGTTTIAAGQTLSTGSNSGGGIYSGAISGAGNLAVSGNTTLSGANTFTGTTTAAGNNRTLNVTGSLASTNILIQDSLAGIATLQTGADALADTAVINNTAKGIYQVDGDDSIGSVSGAGAITLSTGATLTLLDGTTASIDGTIAGAGGLTVSKSGGVVTLTGTNTYSGATTLTAGGLTLAGAGGSAIADAGVLAVEGGTLTLTTDETIGSLISAGGAGGAIVLGANTLTTSDAGAGVTAFGGTISGTGTFVKADGRDLTLSGAITAGELNISAGTLTLTNAANAIASLDLNGGRLNVTDAAALGGAGAIDSTDTSTIALANGVAFNRAIAPTNGTLNLEVGGTATIASTITAAAGATVAKTAAGTLTATGVITADDVVVNGGMLVLNADNTTGGGANSTIGQITVANGTLSLGQNNAAGGAAGNIVTTGSVIDYALNGMDSATPISVTSDTTQLQTLAGITATQSGLISDDNTLRPLEKIGTGELILSADNTYGAAGVGAVQGTNVTAGRLTITGSIDSNTVSVAAGAGLTLGSVSPSADGAVKDDAEVILNGNANLTIATAETIGTLAAADAASTVVLNAGLTVGDNTVPSKTVASQISGAGGLTKVGSGTLALTSTTSNYTGPTTISAGTLSSDNANAFGANAGDILLNGGTWLATESFTQGIGNYTAQPGVTSTIAAANGKTLTLSGNTNPAGNNAVLNFGAAGQNGVVVVTDAGVTNATASLNVVAGTLRVGAGSFATTGFNGVAGTGIANGARLDINGQATVVNVLTGTGAVINDGAAAELQTAGTSSFGGDIQNGTGATSLEVTSGTLTLTGANAYTGTTQVSGGDLRLSGAGAIVSTDVTIANTRTLTTQGGLADDTVLLNNGTLALTGADTIGSLAGSGAVDLAANTLTTGGLNTDTVLSGVVSGTGSLIKVGTGNQTLSADNTAANLTVQNGTLTLTGNNANVATVTVGGGVGDATLRVEGGALLVGGQQIETLGSVISYASGVNMASAIAVNSNDTQLDVAVGSAEQSGLISQLGGIRPLEKTGAGTLVLSAANSYTGQTTVSAGVLDVTGSIASGQVLVQNAASLVVDGASLADTAAVSLTGTGNLTVNTATETVGRVEGVAGTTVVLNAGSGLTFGDAGGPFALGSVISGSGSLTKEGSSTVTVSGNSAAFTGPLVVNNGIMELTGQIGSTPVSVNTGGRLNVTAGGLDAGAVVNATGGQLDISTTDDTVTSITLNTGGEISGDAVLTATNSFGQDTGTLSGTVNVAFGATATLSGGMISGLLTGAGNATTDGTGTTTLSGSATTSGITTQTLTIVSNTIVDETGAGQINTIGNQIDILGGTLRTNGGDGISNDDVVQITAGTMTLTGDEIISGLSGFGTVNLNGASLTTSGNVATTYNGVVQGTGGLNVSGNNVLTLTNTNVFTGNTSINDSANLVLDGSIESAVVTVTGAGKLTLNNGDALLDTASVVLNDTGGMELANANNETIGALTGVAGSTLNLNANTLTVGDATPLTTMAGAISGAGGITKVGTGRLDLAGTTSTYGGATTLTAGTLGIDNANALGAATGTVALNGGTLLGTADTVLTKAAFDLLASSTVAAATGTTLTLSGDFNAGAGTTLTIGNALNAGVVTAAPTGGASNPTARVAIANGTLRMGNLAAGTDLLSSLAGTDIAAPGLLDLGGFATNVNNLTGTGGVINNSATTAALQTNGTSSFDGVIADGPLAGLTALDVQSGALTLTQAQTYTGTTTLSAGNLSLTAAGALASASVDLGANTLSTLGAGLNTATAMTSAGGTFSITGNEEIASFNGTGNITLTGADLTLNSGASAIGAIVTGTGALILTGTAPSPANVTLTGANDFSGGLRVTGDASANLNGASIYTGDTLINTNGIVTVNGTLGAVTGNTRLNNGILTIANDVTQAEVNQSAGSITGGNTLTATTAFTQTGGLVAGLVATPLFNMTNGTISGTGIVTATATANLNSTNSINGSLRGDRTANGTGATVVQTGVTTLSGTIADMASVTVNNGATLVTVGNQRIDDLAEVTIDGTLTLGGDEQILGLAGAATGRVNTEGFNLQLNTPNSDVFAGQINGTGALTQTGGIQTLTGANGFTGPTSVSAGVLNVTGSGSLASNQVTVAGVLNTDGNALAAGATLNNSGTVNLSGAESIAATLSGGVINLTTAASTLTLNTGASTVGGTIGGLGGLTVTGSSVTTLSGANTYSGGTLVQPTGRIIVTGAGTLGADTGSTMVSGGRLTVNTNVTQNNVTQNGGLIDGTGTLTATGTFTQVGVTVDGTVVADAYGLTNGTISTTGSVTASNRATLNGINRIDGTLDGAGTGATTVQTGVTTLGAPPAAKITNMAAITVNSGAGLTTGGAQQIDDAARVTVDGTLTMGGDEVLSGLNGAASGILANGGNVLTLGNLGGSFAGDINGTGGLVVTGGTQTLTGANGYTGPTDVTGGTLSVTGANGTLASTNLKTALGATLATDGGALAAAALITNEGTLSLTGDERVAALSGAGGITLDGADLTLTTGGSLIGGIISGSGGVNVTDTSNTTLSRANLYTGDTVVDEMGALVVTNTGEVAGATRITATARMTNAGKVRAISNAGQLTNSGTAGAVTNTGTATNTGTVASLAQNGGSFDNRGTIIGDAVVRVGRLDHSGGIGGIVTVASGSTANINGGTVTGTTTNNGGTVNINGGTFTGQVRNTTGSLTAAGTVAGQIENAATMSVAAALALDGSIINTNTGIFTTTGTTATTGGLTNAGTVNAQGALNSAVSNSNAFNVTGALTATTQNFDNTARLNVGANSYTGIGTLTNGPAAVIGLTAGGRLGTTTLTNNGIVNANDASVSGAIGNNLTFNAQRAALSGSVTNFAPGVFDMAGGTLSGTANNAGNFILSGGRVTGMFTNTGRVAALGASSVGGLSGSGGVSLLSQAPGVTPDFNTNTRDVLTVNGALSGGNFALDLNMGSDTAVDAGGVRNNLRGGTSDTIIVSGAISGPLNFDFVNQAPVGVGPYLGDSILVLDGTVPSDYAFTYSGLGSGGVVVYSLAKIDNDLKIVSQTSAGIGGIAANTSLVQSLISTVVNRPTSPFVSGLATEEGCSRGGYFRGTYGVSTVEGTSNNGVSTSGSSVKASYAGVQGGYDFGCNDGRFFDGWDGSFGAMIGYNTGKSDQNVLVGVSGGGTATASVTQSKFDQKYAGVYAAFSKDRITTDVQLRFEKTDFTLNESVMPGFFGLGLNNAKFSTNSLNLTGRVSYRMDLNDDGLNFVPTAGLSYTRTSAATVNFVGGETLRTDAFNSIVGFVGGTLAKTTISSEGTAGTTIFGSANYYHDFAGDRNSVFTDSLGGTQNISTKNIGGFGELSLGINYVRILENGPGGAKQLNANLRVDSRFGSNVKKAASITAQLRLSF